MKKVLLLLANGFEIYEASVFIDVIGWNLEEGDKSTKLYTCALQKEIKSAFDQKFVVDFLLDDINFDDFDALAIPGGFEQYGFYKDAYNGKFTEAIKAFHSKGKIIASVCVGALPVGKSGILNGKCGTTYQNPTRVNTLKSYNVEVKKQPIVIEENIITSWNPSTAMDVAYILLEKLTSKENTESVKKLMGFA